MRVEPNNSPKPTGPIKAKTGPAVDNTHVVKPLPAPEHPFGPKSPHDGVHLSEGAHGSHEAEWWEEVAHKSHNPHGTLHAVEAGEQALGAASRVIARVGRVASAAGEGAHAGHGAGHHGIIHKGEKLVETGISKAGSWLGRMIGKLPGGSKLVNATKSIFGAPGRALGAGARAADVALEGTRVGNAVRLTGAGGRLLANVGGRIPVLGAVLGGAIAVVDAKSSLQVLKDPKATTREKAIAGAQGGLSVASGALGVGALGVAAAAAIGLTAPVSVPLLLGAAAITGAGAFALSFFKKH